MAEVSLSVGEDNAGSLDMSVGAGVDGFSPIANVSKVGSTATITITDKTGTTAAS